MKHATRSENATEQGVAEGFGPVADAFLQSLDEKGTSGAALSIFRNGEPVVDLWDGATQPVVGRRFSADTLNVTFSCTKGVASVLIAMLIQEGRLPDYETPIAEVWPEFAAHGKGGVSIGDALAHRAGVSAPRRALSRAEALDPLLMADVLAEQEPLWQPGLAHQYHAVTHGALTAKLVTAATGRSIGAVFRERVASRLGAEVWIGLPAEEEQRVAMLVPGSPPVAAPESLDESAFWVQRAFDLGGALDAADLPARCGMWNEPEIHRAEIPGVGGIATAHGLAKLWSATVTPTAGLRLLEDDSVDRLRRVRSEGRSYFGGEPPFQAWGAGVMVSSDWDPYLSPASFGHDGAGGQVAFADPAAEVGFAYLTNLMGDWERGKAITVALDKVLG